ncbi:MAG: DUF3987 domain-containing protein [Gammaproteobacteria bacterium]|nr:DUF3987 domain-containing protein [Gammaproteobacteria bacterium]
MTATTADRRAADMRFQAPHALPTIEYDPETLRIEIPTAMQQARRWLMWRYEPPEAAGKKARKVPYYITGARRSGTLDTDADRARLSTMEEALSALESRPGYGPAFALGPDEHGRYWQGVDLDGIDRRPELHALVETLPGYVERSPSGTGVHAIGYGLPFASLGSNASGIEAYAAGRYFTVTADAIGGDIEDLAAFVTGTLVPKHHTDTRQDSAPDATTSEFATAGQVAELRSALLHMRSDDRDLWIRMGHALHGLGNVGRGLWLEWSATSEKFDPVSAARTWDSFRAERTGYAAVFAEAQRRGWTNPAKGSGRTGAPMGTDDTAHQPWPEPQPIPATLHPVEPFDTVLLPTSLRGWIEDIAERMQCPPDFPAVGAMVALSSVIGRKAVIRPKQYDDWVVVPNLWGAVVGRPGIMKSPALASALAPLDRLQVKANRDHQDAKKEHAREERLRAMQGKADEAKAQKLIAQGKRKDAEDLLIEAEREAENADQPPVLRRYKVTDASVEALGEILIENPWGTLAYRDELHGLLASMDKEGQEGARAFYLQGYDGNQGYTFDRIVRGRHLHIPAVCLAMLGGIQPGKLKSYVRDATEGGKGDDGLLQRFSLMVWPDVGREWRDVDRWPETAAKNRAFTVFERLDALEPTTDPDTDEPAPTVYRFSPTAQQIFREWRADLEARLREGNLHSALESHLSKYRKLVPALALVCAMADGEAEVSDASLLRALGWAEYLETHARRVYAAGTVMDLDGAVALLAKIQAGAVKDGFKPSDVYLKGWSSLSTPKDVGAAARVLCDLGHLRREEAKPQGPGRPSVTYRVNPATITGC